MSLTSLGNAERVILDKHLSCPQFMFFDFLINVSFSGNLKILCFFSNSLIEKNL